MSRKKVKKEVVKRKTNIYDPMGVYGRGLTKNQRLGMTTQMKIENMSIPKPVITKSLLEEYGKILDFYGMYPETPASTNIVTEIIEIPYTGQSLTIDNNTVLQYLSSKSITPIIFICDAFAIVKDHDIETWNADFGYYILVGDSNFSTYAESTLSVTEYSNDYIVIPAYWMNLGAIHYFKIIFDGSASVGYIDQRSQDLNNQEQYEDFVGQLPQDGKEIPYLLYPNTYLPDLSFGVASITSIQSGYKLRIKVVIAY